MRILRKCFIYAIPEIKRLLMISQTSKIVSKMEHSLLLVATDINMPQGQEAILTTDEEVHYAREYLTVKKEQQQRIEEIE